MTNPNTPRPLGEDGRPIVGFDGIDTVWLAVPITAYGDSVDHLTFRRPNGKDFRACGIPMKFGAQGETIIDTNSLMRLIERLANVPASAVDELDFEDLMAAQAAVVGFSRGSRSTS